LPPPILLLVLLLVQKRQDKSAFIQQQQLNKSISAQTTQAHACMYYTLPTLSP
jgi:hypothetical protein